MITKQELLRGTLKEFEDYYCNELGYCKQRQS